MVNNCFYTKFRAKVVKIFEIYKKKSPFERFFVLLPYTSISFYHQTPAVRILHSTVLDVLQSVVEFGKYRTWFVAKRIRNIIIRVIDFG